MNELNNKLEEARTKFWEKMTGLVLEYDLYTFDPNIKEMERDLMDAYDEATQAIEALITEQVRLGSEKAIRELSNRTAIQAGEMLAQLKDNTKEDE